MKTLLTIAVCFLFSAFTKTNAQKADEDAIKKVIQQETNSFFHKDYDKWADTWLKDSAAFVMRAGPSGQSKTMGWNAINNEYKQSIANLPVYDEAAVAPYLNKTDFNIYINGNMASVSFKEGDKMPSPESRTLVKQNGAWKILNMTIIDGSYALMDAVNNMKTFLGKWELDGKFTVEPDDGSEVKMMKIELKETPNGLEQISDVSYVYNNQTYSPPAECEMFIPDYSQSEIQYMDIQKNTSGQTYTNTGKVSIEQPNSYTVRSMFTTKPTAVQYEYTVTLKDGKWHQVSKNYGMDGKVNHTYTFDMHRM